MAVSREWLRATCQGVRSLNLHRDDGTEMPIAVAGSESRGLLTQFPNLESLDFGHGLHGPVEYAAAATCPNLKTLHCGDYNQNLDEEDLRAVLQGCLQLRELRCELMQPVFALPEEITNLTALTSLDLHYEPDGVDDGMSVTLPSAVSQLAFLQELSLSNNMLTAIHPACFSPASPLRSLSLWSHELEDLPHSFTMLQRLECLQLVAPNLASLPDLSRLSSLTSLDLLVSDALDICPLFSDLPRLRELKVTGNETLRHVPAEIGRYTSLEVLHLLSLNNIATLPESTGQLRSLKELRLNKCRSLNGLPESFSQLQSLQQLELDDLPQLQALPASVELPASLTSLKIGADGPSLLHLPGSLWSCLSLQKLHVANLESASLPEAMGQLTRLTELEITDCKDLQSLSASLHRLPLLQSMSISSCPVLTRVSSQSLFVGSVHGLGDEEVYSGTGPAALLHFLFHLPALTSLYLYGCFVLTSPPESQPTSLLGVAAVDEKAAAPLGGKEGGEEGEEEELGTARERSEAGRQSAGPSSVAGAGAGTWSNGSSSSMLKTLSIRSCPNLTHLPHSLGSLTSLTHLEIQQCERLLHLPDSISSLSSLSSLKLWELGLLSLPESFGLLPSLASLNLRDCGSLTALPESFGRLPCLSRLRVNSCKSLQELPSSFGQLGRLTSLDVFKSRGLRRLCESFGQLSSLQQLRLEDVGLTGLPNSFACLPALVSLHIENVPHFTSLTGCVASQAGEQERGSDLQGSILPSLKKMTIERCSKLRYLPTNFGQMSRLVDISLDCGELLTLPDSLCDLPALVSLCLENVQLHTLPRGIDRLTRLTALRLYDASSSSSSSGGRGCCNTALPDTICQLSALKILSLHAHSVAALPEGMGGLRGLEHLWIAGRSLRALPESLWQLTNLTALGLLHCHSLAELSKCLGNLKELRFLRVQAWRLKALPVSLGQLTNLSRLDMDECKRLHCLPDSFTQLVGLRYVLLRMCLSLVTVPLVNGQLPGSCHLAVLSCPNLQLPDEVMNVQMGYY